MCACDPNNIRTPWCGKPGCEPPEAAVPVSPEELGQTMAQQVDSAIRVANGLLREKFPTATGRRILIAVSRLPVGPARQDAWASFKRSFENRGWKVEYHSDQRDGDYVSFCW